MNEPAYWRSAAGAVLDQRQVAADAGRREQAAGAQDAYALGDGPGPVGGRGQVVERAEQQDHVGAAVRLGEPAGVAQLGGHALEGRGRLDMRRDRVDDVHAVAVGREPRRVDAGRAADVQDPQIRPAQVAAQQLPGAQELQPAVR